MPSKTNSGSVAPAVAEVFDGYDEVTRTSLLELRALILATADETPGVGPLTETLKWGQAAYLTGETKSGSTIRIAATAVDSAHDYAMYFICHTHLVDRFEELFPEAFDFDGGRALLFSNGADRSDNELRQCVAMALTYHL